jgi:aspartyl-tRNA(Asn)/glutamyl-tRNA(Gln) amidotransferase subunit A
VPFGRVNMDEFAMGSATENSALQVTRNPRDLTRIPGGSSGGSAAAVAADLAIAALGSDTGGSIRQPASHCGVVGLKPSYGRVSRYGLVAFASSLDQIGPLTKSVEDAALILQAIAGADPRDSTCLDVPVPDYAAELEKGVAGLKIGIPREYFGEGIDPAVLALVQQSAQRLQAAGAELVDISLPHTEHAVATYYIIAPAEASSNLSRFDGIRYGKRAAAPADLLDLYRRSREEGFGPEVKRRIILGTYVLSSGYYDAYYSRAQKVRTLIRKDFESAFQQVDAILTPVAPAPARKNRRVLRRSAPRVSLGHFHPRRQPRRHLRRLRPLWHVSHHWKRATEHRLRLHRSSKRNHLCENKPDRRNLGDSHHSPEFPAPHRFRPRQCGSRRRG